MKKFFHCADLHLDSKMESNLPRELANIRRSEIRNTFCRLATKAQREGVSAVLIAGDMFDTVRATKSTLEVILDAIANAPNVDFLYLRGNHDDCDLFANTALPPNFKRFDNSWTQFKYDNVTISGIEITSQNYKKLYSDLCLDSHEVNIVVVHGQPSTTFGICDINLNELSNKNIDYLALGHIHKYAWGSLDSRGIWAQPGCLEGRGFDELGPKGFIELSINGNQISHQFIPFASRTLTEVNININDLKSLPDFIRELKAASANIDPTSLVKFTLRGKYSLETNKDLQALANATKDWFFYSKINDASKLQIDPAQFEGDISLKGEFVRTVAQSNLSNLQKDKVLAIGLSALLGQEVYL